LIELTCSYKHPTRSQQIAGYLLHNTGSSDGAAALAYYQENDHGVTPHFVIGRSGDTYSLVPIDKVAYHLKVSSAQAKTYAERWPKEAPEWWVKRWPKLGSPLELFTGNSPNGRSIGIELIGSGGNCSNEQYDRLSELLLRLAADGGPKLSRRTVVGHSDVNPLGRSDRHGPTDPGRNFDWGRLYKMLRLPDDDEDLGDDGALIPLAVDGAPIAHLDNSEVRQVSEDIDV
jgi:N-acetyl-anhydromuramyl-L-alanine amidase AmpD